MSNGAADVNANQSGVTWLGRDASGEVVDVSGSTAIDLSATLGTTHQKVSLGSLGGHSLALRAHVARRLDALGAPFFQSISLICISRQSGEPWCAIPAIETFTDSGGAIFSYGTIWKPAGDGVLGTLPMNWLDIFTGLLDETVVIVQPQDFDAGDPATVTTSFADPNADLAFGVVEAIPGDWGNLFSVQFVDPGTPDADLSVTSDDGYALQINLATDGSGVIYTTANDVLKVIRNNVADQWSFSPWVIDATAIGTGAGIVEATAVLPLTGGDGGATGVTYSVKGSV